MNLYPKIAKKIDAGLRINRDEIFNLWQTASDDNLAYLSTQVRNRFHSPDEATYLIMCIINYTNVCVAKCDYCAFYRLPHQTGTYLLNYEDICERVEDLIGLGGTMVGFNGGFHPKLKIQDYAEIFRKIRRDYGDQIEFYGLTVAEFMFTCKLSRVDYAEGAKFLKDNGSNWITGGGAEILDDGFRFRHSPGKYTVADYYNAQRAIVEAGLGSTATMVIGFDETIDERLNHLESLRNFQDSLDEPLTSFLCWTFKPDNTQLGGTEVSDREYLRWLAICRIYLDNFTHIRTSVLTKNKIALDGLRYGANDFDLPTEDEVTQRAGATISLEFEQILSKSRQLGFKTTMRKPFAVQQTLGFSKIKSQAPIKMPHQPF